MHAKKTVKKPWQLLFFALSFYLVYFLKLHSVFIIVGSALLGILIAWCSGALHAAAGPAADSSAEPAGSGEENA